MRRHSKTPCGISGERSSCDALSVVASETHLAPRDSRAKLALLREKSRGSVHVRLTMGTHGADGLATIHARGVTSIPQLRHRGPRSDVDSVSRVSPLSPSGFGQRSSFPRRCTFRHDVVVRLLPQLRSWARAHRKNRPRTPLPRGRAAEPSFTRRRTTECRSLPDTGLSKWLVAHPALENASRVPTAAFPRTVRFRSTTVFRRSPRARGPVMASRGIRRDVGSSPCSNQSPSTLVHRRRALPQVGAARQVTPSTEARPRRRLREESRLLAHPGAFDRHSFVRAPKRTNPFRCMLERAEAHRL